MPSLRVLAVFLLVGMGATAAAVGPIVGTGDSDARVRGSSITGSPSPAPSPSPEAFDVRVENQKPGTPNWLIGRARGTRGKLAGYTGALSVRSGQPVPLSVSGAGPVRVRALRIGWYGGVGARQVWQGTIRARLESGNPADWPSRGFADTTGWPEGHYLLRLDQGNASRYLPLTVRSAENQGRIVVLTAPLTWQAENTPAAPVTTAPAELPKISLDRPYTAGFGAAGFLEQDVRIVQLAERSGRSIGYATDYDVATDPTLLTGAAAILTGGDSQYWTASLRTAIRTAEDAGTNLAFFGAGTGARRIRLADAGRALQISRSGPATSPRLTGLSPSCSPVGTGPDPAADWVVRAADWPGYRGTGVQAGDVLPGLVAGRVDRFGAGSTAAVTSSQVLAQTQVGCVGLAGPVTQNGVYLVRSSGAAVFNAGTGRWACALTGRCTDLGGRVTRIDPNTQKVVTRITRNLIKDFATPEAGAARS